MPSMECRLRRFLLESLEGTVSSPTHPFWSDATTAPPNCSFGTYIPTPRPHPGAALVLAGSSASTRLSSSMKRRGVRAYTESGYLYVPAACENGSESGQSAVCTLHSTVVSKMWAKSTTSSFETPDTMTGLTPTTSSFFTPSHAMAASGRSKPDQRQSEGMLGLVGLFGRRLPRSRRKADAGCERDDRPIASITEPLGFHWK